MLINEKQVVLAVNTECVHLMAASVPSVRQTHGRDAVPVDSDKCLLFGVCREHFR